MTLPIVDVSGLRGTDRHARDEAAAAIRAACLDKGFFYCTGHGVDPALVRAVFAQSALLFDLPDSEKLALSKDRSPANRGYEPLRGQTLEPGMPADLKEGYYIGMHVDADDERAQRYFNTGPNVWPGDMPEFRAVMLRYFDAMLQLSGILLEGIALSLDLPQSYFDDFRRDPMATLRLLHYPPQPPDSEPDEKGCGAHTDFGGITILLQDEIGGLQVLDQASATWIDGTPIPGAFVVNLGDLIGRWTNELYRSTVHRVINRSGRERYSVPFFFAGRPDYPIACIPTCLSDGEAAKYRTVTVDAHMRQRYAGTYV